MNDSNARRTELKINGMRCSSCEVLIERKIKKLPGVQKVNVSHVGGKAEVYHNGEIDVGAINDAIKSDGYSVSSSFSSASAGNMQGLSSAYLEQKKNSREDYIEIGAMFVVVVGLYLFLNQFDLLPGNLGISDNMSYLFVFGLGLVAALSTCLAVTGGLLLGIAAKHAEKNPQLTGAQKFKPHIYFNLGRVLSYTFLGGLVGLLGSVLTLSPAVNGLLIVFVSFVMLALGLQMLGFTFLNKITPKMPKFIAHRIYDSTNSDKKAAPALFGASTFFLPCGFTQALQLYVLSTGSFTVGALTMFAFSLGTLPALMSIGAISSYSKGDFKRYFVKFAGILVILLGVLSINSGLALTGSAIDLKLPSLDKGSAPADQNVQLIDGKQIVKMKVIGLDYYPDKFTLKKGVPVEWRIDGTEASGCAQILSVPKLGITRRFNPGAVTIITFTPEKTGEIRFTCGMGMAGPGVFKVV